MTRYIRIKEDLGDINWSDKNVSPNLKSKHKEQEGKIKEVSRMDKRNNYIIITEEYGSLLFYKREADEVPKIVYKVDQVIDK